MNDVIFSNFSSRPPFSSSYAIFGGNKHWTQSHPDPQKVAQNSFFSANKNPKQLNGI
jgi:hypothetical protein